MFIAAVTGTNGKTSVVEYARQLLGAHGISAGSLGTLGFVSETTGRQDNPITGRTPQDLRQFVDGLEEQLGIQALVFEAVSLALHRGQHVLLEPDVGAFTNLTADHLDMHGSLASYELAKSRLFLEVVRPGGAAVIDVSTPAGLRMLERASQRGLDLLRVGAPGADLHVHACHRDGPRTTLDVAIRGQKASVSVQLFASFEHQNLLAAIGICLRHPQTTLEGLLDAAGQLRPPPGRMVSVGHVRGAVGIVDYAHNPGGLRAALDALRAETPGRLHLVFGAGGDRDLGKRWAMGRAAADLADVVVVTDDNPRDEDPAEIRAAILGGCPDAVEVADRRAAIRHAVAGLRPGDTLLVAGKGDEGHQEFAGHREPFSDIEVLAAELEAAGGQPWPR